MFLVCFLIKSDSVTFNAALFSKKNFYKHLTVTLKSCKEEIELFLMIFFLFQNQPTKLCIATFDSTFDYLHISAMFCSFAKLMGSSWTQVVFATLHGVKDSSPLLPTDFRRKNLNRFMPVFLLLCLWTLALLKHLEYYNTVTWLNISYFSTFYEKWQHVNL